MLGTSILPTEVAEQISLTVIQVKERMKMLENQAPSYSFNTKYTVRNRHLRCNISRTTVERRLITAMKLQLQEYDREFKVFDIDEQWLELRAHLHRIKLADSRQKRPREAEEDIVVFAKIALPMVV
jgi:hypothetical protein